MPTAPFNFLGTMSQTQFQGFEAWIAAQEANTTAISAFHQRRANQLRKSSGLLENYFRQVDPRCIYPTFAKKPWEPVADGHFTPLQRDDCVPANAMARIKANYQDQLSSVDEAVFRMNFLRTRIEAHEDMAQEQFETVDDDAADLERLRAYFADPAYQGCLVRDQDDLYLGEPKYRVSPWDPPTPWELAIARGEVPT
jgi:hypothetical protein